MRSALIVLVFVTAVTAMSNRRSGANEIVNTLPGEADNAGAVIGNTGDGNQYAEAAEFTLAAGPSYTLDRITLALADALNSSGGSPVTAILLTNNAGTPGTALESLSSTVASGLPFSGTNTLFTSATHPLLNGGGSYWIAVETNTTSVLSWLQSATSGTSLTSFDGGTTWVSDPTFNAAYKVEGTPTGPVVPEPGALVLLVTGLLGLVGVRRLPK
jgi:hypothetical protein